MAEPIFDTTHEDKRLDRVHEGMRATDTQGRDLGKVDYVFLGEGGSVPGNGEGAATATPPTDRDSEMENLLRRAFGARDLPREFRQRMYRNGFVHLTGTGISELARFVPAEHVVSVSGDSVVVEFPEE